MHIIDKLVNPIHILGMRSSLRTVRYFVVFTISLLLVSLVMFFTTVASIDSSPADIGRVLFIAFCVIQYIVISLVFPAFGSTALIQEKERQTYDLLVSSKLKPYEIIWGKFLVAFSNAFLFLIAPLPIVVISFLFGGVTVFVIVLAYAFFFCYSALLIIDTILISAVVKSLVRAIIIAYITSIIVAFFVGGFFIAFLVAYLWGDPDLSKLLQDATTFDYTMFVLSTTSLVLVAFLWPFSLAANSLKLPSANRATSIRVLMLFTVAVLTTLICFWFSGYFSTVDWSISQVRENHSDFLFFAVITFYPLWMVLLLLFAWLSSTEDPLPKPAVLQRLEKARQQSKWRFIVPTPVAKLFLPGSLNGSLFVVILAVASSVAFFYTVNSATEDLANLTSYSDRSAHGFYYTPIICCSFLFFTTMFGTFLSFRMAKIRWRRVSLFAFLILLIAALPMYIVLSIAVFEEFSASLFNLQYFSPPIAYFSAWVQLEQLKSSKIEPLDLFIHGIPLYLVSIFTFSSGGILLLCINAVNLRKRVIERNRIGDER